MRGDAGFPVRLRFAKRGRIRFLSHRDVARAFERAFRVVALPLAFTSGFSPRPKVSFGLALPVGQESDAEYLDVELAEPLDPGRLPGLVSGALPEGLTVTGAVALADRAPALQESVTSVAYELVLVEAAGGCPPDVDVVAAAVDAATAAAALPVTRSRKGDEVTEDVRPALRRLAVAGRAGDGVHLDLEVATRPRATRPADVLVALQQCGAPVLDARRVVRTRQWIERGGARLEPLDADPRPPAVHRPPAGTGTAGPHAPEARAS